MGPRMGSKALLVRAEYGAVLLAGAVLGGVVADTVVPRLDHRIVGWIGVGRAIEGVRDPAEANVKALFAYLLVLLWVALGLAASGLLLRRPALRRGWMILAALATFAMSWRSGVALVTGIPLALLVGVQRPVCPPAHPSAAVSRLEAILGAISAALALAWGLRLVLSPRVALIAVPLLVVTTLAWTLRRLRRGELDGLACDGLGASPALLLPLAGLLRSPSPWLLVLVAGLSLALRVVLHRRPRIPRAGSLALAFFVVTLLVVPLRLHELALNYDNHEGYHLAWIQSAFEGKLLMADADTAYGALREYVLVAWTWLSGSTAYDARAGFVLANVACLPLLLAMGWRVARGRGPVFAFFVLGLAGFTPLRFFLTYEVGISLGWIDLARAALALAAVLWGVPAVTGDEPRRWPGVLLGVALLYSPEMALCGAGALGVAAAAHGLATGDVRAVLRRGAFVGGAALVPVLGWTAVYAAFGKAGVFLRTLFRWVLGAGAGLFQSGDAPFGFEVIEQPRLLFERPANWWSWCPASYLAPHAVYLVTAATLVLAVSRRRWTRRATERLAWLAFGLAAYRIPLNRPDMWHLVAATLPALLLAADLLLDVVARGTAGHVAMGLAGAVALWMTNADDAVVTRLRALSGGHEAPSRGAARVHPDLPRAGDVPLDGDIEQAARYIVGATSPGDAIFCRVAQLGGAELYFLTGRRDPTRFDAMAEIVTRADQREVLEALRRDPPVLVVGKNSDYVGEETDAWLARSYEEQRRFGDIVISRWRGALP